MPAFANTWLNSLPKVVRKPAVSLNVVSLPCPTTSLTPPVAATTCSRAASAPSSVECSNVATGLLRSLRITKPLGIVSTFHPIDFPRPIHAPRSILARNLWGGGANPGKHWSEWQDLNLRPFSRHLNINASQSSFTTREDLLRRSENAGNITQSQASLLRTSASETLTSSTKRDDA